MVTDYFCTGTTILIERDAPETKTADGIVLPDTAKKRKDSGVIRLVSPKVLASQELRIGDQVFWSSFKAEEVTLTVEGRETVFVALDAEDVTVGRRTINGS